MDSRVSVILLCYNQAAYVEEAIRSVYAQDHRNLELIIVDDASTDGSPEVIHRVVQEFPGTQCLLLQQNQGNCTAFNRGFRKSTGAYIIDLAADDKFLPGKITLQLERFSQLDRGYGVVFTDVKYIDEQGNDLGDHSGKIARLGRYAVPPEGDIFLNVLRDYFISSPSMMIKREVLEELGGYDEELTYEDFDFWVRSSRNWKYAYLDTSTMVVRKLSTGMSAGMYLRNDPKVPSTLKVVEKASKLVRTSEEQRALLARIKYEMRMCLKYGNRPVLSKWSVLYRKYGGRNPVYRFLR